MFGIAAVFFALSFVLYGCMSTYASVHKSEHNATISSLFPSLSEFQGSNSNHQACVARDFTHQVTQVAFPEHTNYQMGQWVTQKHRNTSASCLPTHSSRFWCRDTLHAGHHL